MQEVGFLAGIYPVVWGVGQLVTGRLGDTFCKKHLLSLGMLLQGVAIATIFFSQAYGALAIALVLLGIGTALVYPNFLSVVAENTHPTQRPQSLGIFRFWRDFGYVAGALAAGIVSDWLGIESVLLGVALLTIVAGLLGEVRMCCSKKQLWHSKPCSLDA